jgi:tRNA (guanine10-N2)-dimethyltransferase
VAGRIVLLSGEHSTLPRAELSALLAVHDPTATLTDLSPTVVRIIPGSDAATDIALRGMALCHAVSDYWGHGDLLDILQTTKCAAGLPGSFAVRAKRTGTDQTLRSRDVEQELGRALADDGHPIDLTFPDQTITAWIHDGIVAVGAQLWDTDRTRFERRVVTDRAHFSPVTMHPRRAATLVHLAQVPTGGRILDPFCGTGGLVLEAALDGFDSWGSDIDDWMVQGTLQTLADAGPEPLAATVFTADIGDVQERVENIDGIATDLPYGRASTTDNEAVGALYQRAFAAFAEILVDGKRAVIGCADLELGRKISEHGFVIEEIHAEYVHKSLTRHYLVARRVA